MAAPRPLSSSAPRLLALCGLLLLTSSAAKSTLGKLDEFLEDNQHAGQCQNGICTVHGPGGVGEYSEVFEQFVPEFFAGAQDLQGLMEAAKKAGENGDFSAMTKLATKQAADSQKKLGPFVSQIYEQFVSPQSPGVDPETGRAMVKEFLIACQRHMPLLARQSMDTGVKFGAMMGGGAADPSLIAQMEQQMKDYMPQVTKTMSAVITELISRSDSMADDIFSAMDGNKDGIVTRKEFEKDFVTSMQQIVNMQALAQTAQKVMESISPKDMEQLASMIPPDMLKQLGNMDPEMLMEQLKGGGMEEMLSQMGGGLGGLGGGGARRGRANPLGRLQ